MLCSLMRLASIILTGLVGLSAAMHSVVLDTATFVGTTDDYTNRFLGIPYALPPIEDRRFNVPAPNDAYTGTQSAYSFGPTCPQQSMILPPDLPLSLDLTVLLKIATTIFNASTPQSEDCLTLNVWTPPNLQPGAALPVVVWIHGGGFEVGGSAQYDGGIIVKRSIELGEPIVYVSINYRLAAFGFLPGREAQAAGIGNLGYQDQRLALRWIQKYIHAFGGDPSKVTLWGESAGAMSVASHMLTNDGNTEGLFRGAFMNSGSLLPVGDMAGGQQFYDDLVSYVGCANTSDTLECLRRAPYERLMAGVDASRSFLSYQSVALAWVPRADGNFLTDVPRRLALQGSVAKIPFVIGGCDDEGTLFALPTLNITTDEALHQYLSTIFFPTASGSDIDQLLSKYPADHSQGSPFDTGHLNAVTPQFKRIAAILGDLVFEAPRRFLLQERVGKQNAWSFSSKRFKSLAVLGSGHVTDLFNAYGPDDLTDYLINFVNHLDPNGANTLQLNFDWPQTTRAAWPQYDFESKQVLTLMDGSIPVTITHDTYREDAISYMTTFTLTNPLQ